MTTAVATAFENRQQYIFKEMQVAPSGKINYDLLRTRHVFVIYTKNFLEAHRNAEKALQPACELARGAKRQESREIKSLLRAPWCMRKTALCI
jgi:hypothetical protein